MTTLKMSTFEMSTVEKSAVKMLKPGNVDAGIVNALNDHKLKKAQKVQY